MSPSTLTLPIVKLDTSHAQGRLIIGPDGHSLYQYATHDQRKGAHATYHLRRISPGGGYVNVAAFEAKSVTLPGRFRSVAYKHLFAHRPLIGLPTRFLGADGKEYRCSPATFGDEVRVLTREGTSVASLKYTRPSFLSRTDDCGRLVLARPDLLLDVYGQATPLLDSVVLYIHAYLRLRDSVRNTASASQDLTEGVSNGVTSHHGHVHHSNAHHGHSGFTHAHHVGGGHSGGDSGGGAC